jgi:asparagine synthase (glutamine-hydrolysing)
MCGIAGTFYFYDDQIVNDFTNNKIIQSLKNRGPDGHSSWTSDDKKVSLIHTRLSIFDTSENGKQPMIDCENRYLITFNGSIFNYKELRNFLIKKGHVFKSNTDTEVVLNLFKEKGNEFSNFLNGIYAFAIYDKNKRELILSRDELGVKPLYYYNDQKKIFFASLVKTVAINDIKKKINQNSITNFYLYGHIAEPQTIFENVIALEPGLTISINSLGLKTVHKKKLFDSENIYKSNSKIESLKYINYLIEKNIKIQNRSDVNCGIFLSSGIDSSKILLHSKKEFKAININFEDYKNTKDYEGNIPILLTNINGNELLSKSYNKFEVKKIYEKFLLNMDQPTTDGLNTFLASDFASKNNIKIVLSGLGADEILNGYSFYEYIINFKKFKVLYKNINKLLSQKRILDYLKKNQKFLKFNYLLNNSDNLKEFYINFRKINYENQISDINNNLDISNVNFFDIKSFDNKNSDLTNIKILELTNYVRNQLLKDSDWTSMSNGVELRVPFLTKKIINFALFDPYISKMKKKNIIKFDNSYISKLILNRKKTGFTVPFQKWFKRNCIENTDFVLKKYFEINNLNI